MVVVIDDERQRVAFHEAGHGLLAVLLEIPLTALSLRPGDGFRAVTVFDPTEAAPDLDYSLPGPLQDFAARFDAERHIIATLAGPRAAFRGAPLTGYVPPDDDETAARLATEALATLTAASADRLLAAEAVPDEPGTDDESKLWNGATRVNGFDGHLAAMHLLYLQAVTDKLLDRHSWSLRTSAEALYRESVLSGARVVQLARSCRCACHLDWGPPRADPSRPAIDAAATR